LRDADGQRRKLGQTLRDPRAYAPTASLES